MRHAAKILFVASPLVAMSAGLAVPAYAGDAAMRALEATIQQQAIIQQQQREQQMRQQQEQARQREALQPTLITGPDGEPVDASGNARKGEGSAGR